MASLLNHHQYFHSCKKTSGEIIIPCARFAPIYCVSKKTSKIYSPMNLLQHRFSLQNVNIKRVPFGYINFKHRECNLGHIIHLRHKSNYEWIESRLHKPDKNTEFEKKNFFSWATSSNNSFFIYYKIRSFLLYTTFNLKKI